MSVVPLPFPDTDAPADRVMRVAGALLATYLAVTTWPLAAVADHPGAVGPLVVHVVALMTALGVTASRRADIRWLRDLLPLFLGPFLYVELRWLIPAVGRPHADMLVMHWEHGLFSGNPSATWAPAM